LHPASPPKIDNRQIMHRRKFLAAATALPLALSASTDNGQPLTENRQLIELRTYEIKFLGSGKGVLMAYLNEALAPALKRLGCPTFRIMTELGTPIRMRTPTWLARISAPTKSTKLLPLTITPYPSTNQYLIAIPPSCYSPSRGCLRWPFPARKLVF